MLEDYLENESEAQEQKEAINKNEIKKGNLYDKYLNGSEKLTNEKSSFITEILNENKIIIGRKFFGENNQIKYIEMFNNEKMNLLGISKNITFIHEYKFGKEIDTNEFMGFRYYEYGPLSENLNYFTLLKKYESKYYILEKNKNLKDRKGNPFYNENVNCYLIIKKIISEKYKKYDTIIAGDTFPEIIGYCYGLIDLGKFKNFICVEPLIPNFFIEGSLEEKIPEITNLDNVYIEPLIYDNHISVIIISRNQKNRLNIILDMSRYHTSTKKLNSLIFPTNIIKSNMYSVYPKIPIQNGSSCCLWFYGEMECLINSDKYFSFKTIFENLKGESLNFFIDIINIISEQFLGFEVLMKKDIFDAYNIDFTKYFTNSKVGSISINKNIIYSQFLDIKPFFDFSYFNYSIELNFFTNIQKEFMKYINYKMLLEMNLKFHKILKVKDKVIMKLIEEEIDFTNDIIKDFKNKYILGFYQFIIDSSKNRLLGEILNGNKFKLFISEELKDYINKLDFNLYLSENNLKLTRRKKELQTNFSISSEDDILRLINQSNQICFKVMNK